MGTVRIIAGRYKGRRINVPKGDAVRPTPERVREALFSMLGDLGGMHVVDAFAGTGALGIEALSRGASHVTFIEADRPTAERISTTLHALGTDASSYTVIRGSALQHLSRLHAVDVLLCDPPYAEAATVAGHVAEALSEMLTDNGIAVIECDKRDSDAVAVALGGDAEVRRYGDTTLVIHVDKNES